VTLVFADTFYWIALTVPADAAHERASQIKDEIITTDEVLSEYLTFFCETPEYMRHKAARNVQDILRDSTVRVVPQSRESFLAGLELYRARPDKGYSLTDCVSMHTMRLQGITDALTNDRHFEQEGFRAVFRDS
jgi:uncharacterized protein